MMDVETLFRDLPDPESAKRFLDQFEEKHPSRISKLTANAALASDVLTLVSHSPLLASTLLQNPEYIQWLEKERKIAGVRSKEEFLESLARFSMTNSQIEPQVLFARFRRRELLRIFLADIRRLSTVAEVTEDLSNLADAVLESALRIARQELDNRYGQPLEIVEGGRGRAAEFCIVSLGKLGSRELNYSSDIDLVFIYSADGTTSGGGTRGQVTNREYFAKLSETIIGLVGRPTGEGAAYRVDMRLRPHGRVGPIALSVDEMIRYYSREAAPWERQVLIRSRASAGESRLYQQLFSRVEDRVFSSGVSVPESLANVRSSKHRIDLEKHALRGIDVKLGKGGIREIEFIAQALQLAYGASERWLRVPHTLISLQRLADRGLLKEHELTELFRAYEFLRRLEHVLQMENGSQTHLVPDDSAKRTLVARRMKFTGLGSFDDSLLTHTRNVNRIFMRVFGLPEAPDGGHPGVGPGSADFNEPSSTTLPSVAGGDDILATLCSTTPRFAGLLRRNPQALAVLDNVTPRDSAWFRQELAASIEAAKDLGSRLAALRRTWSRALAEIVLLDLSNRITIDEIKSLQTDLAEAAMEAAFGLAATEMTRRTGAPTGELAMSALGLGKLGSGSLDYDSDLDLVIVYDETSPAASGFAASEFFSRCTEIFVNALSGVTREGALYRVDLRLRPYGKDGTNSISRPAFDEYMRANSSIWEWLAYLKARAAAGDLELGKAVETHLREIIFDRAGKEDGSRLAEETCRIRFELENEKSRNRRGVNIKFGEGGLLDVYFAVRYLQLRYSVADDPDDRSTKRSLRSLKENGSLAETDHANLEAGYSFLSELDHHLRLIVGRSTQVPYSKTIEMETVSRRMKLESTTELFEILQMHRLNIRASFENILQA